jgi:6-phosphogluconolactonase
MITVHRINDAGMPGPAPVETHKTAKTAHMILPDASNRFVLVPHRDSDMLLQFLFDGESGRLSPNSPDRMSQPRGAGPRHLCFHPNGRWIYVSNELNSTVTACSFDGESGTAAPIQTLSTLPEGYRGKNTCAQIHMIPNGRYMYVSNRGHDSIAGFAVDPETGLLEERGIASTEPIPRAFNINADGRFLFAAGRDSGQLAVHRIDQSSGSLARIGSCAAGNEAMWVLPVTVGD